MGAVASIAKARDRKAAALKQADAKQGVRAASRARLLAGAEFASALGIVAGLWHEFVAKNDALLAAVHASGVEIDAQATLMRIDLLRAGARAELGRWGVDWTGGAINPDVIPAFADVLAATDESIAIQMRRASGL